MGTGPNALLDRVEVVDVPLSGRDERLVDRPEDEHDRRPHLVPLGVLGAVVLAIGTIMIVVADADDDAAPPTTDASSITTPPTLPRPTDRTFDTGTESAAARSTPFAPPEYPLAGVAADGDFRLTADSFDEPTEVVVTTDASDVLGPSSTAVAHDRRNDRYEITTTGTAPDGSAFGRSMIVDAPTGDRWVRLADGGWTRATAADTTAYHQLLLGPVDADALDAATNVEAGEVHELPDGTAARRYMLTVPAADAAPLWNPTPDDVTDDVVVEVFVDRAGRVRLLHASSDIGGVRRFAVHQRAPGAESVSVDLPDAALAGGTADEAEPFDPMLLRPTYVTVDAGGVDMLANDLYAAVDELLEHPPAASTSRLISATATARIVAERDDRERRRAYVSQDSLPGTLVLVSDPVTRRAATYGTDPGSVSQVPAIDPAGLLLDERLVSGPLTTRSMVESTIEGIRPTRLDDGTVAVEYEVTILPARVILPIGLPMVLDLTRPIRAFVFVADGLVHEVQVLSNEDPLAYVQRFDRGARPVIALT